MKLTAYYLFSWRRCDREVGSAWDIYRVFSSLYCVLAITVILLPSNIAVSYKCFPRVWRTSHTLVQRRVTSHTHTRGMNENNTLLRWLFSRCTTILSLRTQYTKYRSRDVFQPIASQHSTDWLSAWLAIRSVLTILNVDANIYSAILCGQIDCFSAAL